MDIFYLPSFLMDIFYLPSFLMDIFAFKLYRGTEKRHYWVFKKLQIPKKASQNSCVFLYLSILLLVRIIKLFLGLTVSQILKKSLYQIQLTKYRYFNVNREIFEYCKCLKSRGIHLISQYPRTGFVISNLKEINTLKGL